MAGCGGATQSSVATPANSPTSAAAAPAARTYGVMLSLGQTGGVMLLMGENAPPPPFGSGQWVEDTWVYTHPGGWGQPGQGASAMYGPAAFDSSAGRVIVLDAMSSTLDSWIYDPGSKRWQTKASPAGAPTGVLGAGFVYDSKSDRCILFGGVRLATLKLNDETWAYDFGTGTWTKMTPAVSPSPRNFGVMAYDDKSGKTILFGGGDANGDGLGDTWAYDYASDTWTDLKPAHSPPPRDYAAMAYDPKSNRMILFGGVNESNGQTLGDTWAYDVEKNTWTQLTPATAPSARGWLATAYDASSGNVVLFGGGVAKDQPQKDTWLFDPTANTWAPG